MKQSLKRLNYIANEMLMIVDSNGITMKIANDLKKQINGDKIDEDDTSFSVEHFIVSESKNKKMMVQGDEYRIGDTIYKRYVNNFFNFIFINKIINSELENKWLPDKLIILNKSEILCEYSKMIIQKANKLGQEFERRAGEDYKDRLDLFFAREFKDVYIEYIKNVLENIIRRING